MSPISSLQTKLSPSPSSGKYSSIESEEDTTSPTQSQFYGLRGKIVSLSAILSPVFLLLLVLNLRISSHLENDYTTRTIFGDIPWTRQTFGGNDNFLHADPYDGQAWTLYKNQNFDPERQSTVWDDIYPSNFIAVENPQQFGFQGGVELSAEAQNSTDFVAGSQGFGLAFLHQIHCVGVLKHYLSYVNRSEMTAQQNVHTDHCIEVLRQLILCKADLSVQRPKGLPSSTRWPSQQQHICRDERVLMDAIWSRAIVKADGGWIRRRK
ncbi:uncharacterized protein EAF02_007141 [Botrytis sinoallii]|uniref:uncharacterized protein n=1 Tax=Botrytis sinoallii TaxID=1463999 RepID=UPI0018FFAD5C|nr:uncharacterized protein EAF02_007141 [Botrytis sinoallii]KAF7880295.1 hypothetical protein EAF02_007141 [Botrytis sinoallii]